MNIFSSHDLYGILETRPDILSLEIRVVVSNNYVEREPVAHEFEDIQHRNSRPSHTRFTKMNMGTYDNSFLHHCTCGYHAKGHRVDFLSFRGPNDSGERRGTGKRRGKRKKECAVTCPLHCLDTYRGPLPSRPTWYASSGEKRFTKEGGDLMRFYNTQHPFYCGIDLHARAMYVCILDQAGETLLHRNMKTTPEAFLKAIAPYRPHIVVAVECMFTWYWLADLCADEEIPFVLGHALYMKAIHGGKAKNDRIDSHKIAVLLRGGMLPQAYVYPAEMRATRDLLRRRMHLAHKRGELLAHVQNTNSQYNLPAIGKNIAYKANRDGVAERFADPAVQKSIEVDLALVSYYDELLRDVEFTIMQTAKQHDANTLYLLQPVPCIGKILSLVLLDEIHHIDRFPRV